MLRRIAWALAILLCASPAIAQTNADAESRELRVYRLTLPNVQKATAAALAIAEAFRKDARLKDAAPAMTDEGSSLAAIERDINKSPVIAAIVKANGLIPREYAKCMVVSIGAQVAVAMAKTGLPGGSLATNSDIAPENFAWVTANPAPMAALTRALDAMGR